MPFMLMPTLLLVSLLAAPAEGPYGAVQTEQNSMVPMRDGVRLATDIFRPARDGRPLEERLPILFQRTPYDKTGRSLVERAKFFASHGYVVALQDLRGTYASEGEFTKYIGEGQDGYDAIEYLAKLPYGNGRIGMWGTSYAAHVQANAAKLRPPSLATIVLNMGGMSNGWDHKIRNHGAFELQQLTWAFRQLENETTDPVVKKRLELEPVDKWLHALPLRKGLNPLAIAPNFEDYVLTMMTSGDYDEYWQHHDINWQEHYDETLDIPMVLVSGWYDSYAGGTVTNYVELEKRLDSTLSLVMGPWTHGGNTRGFAGDVSFGEAGAIADFHDAFHLRWFDRVMKGTDAEEASAPVRLFVMGTGDGRRDENGRMFHGGYWREADRWPLPGTRETRFYLHTDGTLSEDPPRRDVPPTTFTFDPADPVPTIGGAFSSTSPVFEPGAYDQRETEAVFGAKEPYLPLAARADVVVFQTAPLAEPLEVVGPITVDLYVASTAVDTDFTVKLVDVYPPSEDYPRGFEMNVTDGILRTRYRNSAERQELMTPGEIYRITLEPFPTANVFKRGHRLRLDISSSNFPRFDVNPNTGEPLGKHRRMVSADNSIYHDSSHASRLVLPVVPAEGSDR